MAIEGIDTRGDLERFVKQQMEGGTQANLIRQLQTQSAGVVTALPADAVEGQEVLYVADDAGVTGGPVLWHLHRRGGKWEFIGGNPLFTRVDTNQILAITVNTWGDLATVGPDLTVPLAGDYYVEFGATMGVGANGQTVRAGVAQAAGGTPVGNIIEHVAPTATVEFTSAQQERFTALAAGGLLRMRYQPGVVAGGTPSAARRWLKVWPWRLT